MERHSVPQNIMDVEFKLFGALTIRQFAYLAGGFVVALFIYFLDLPFLLKFVSIIISVILGLFLSLVRINGQTSATWLSNFILAIFTSQQRVWRKGSVTPDILKESTNPIPLDNQTLVTRVRKDVSRLPAMPLAGLIEQPTTPMDIQESERLRQIDEHFDFEVKQLDPKVARESQVKRDATPPSVAPPPFKMEQSIAKPVVNPSQGNLAGAVADRNITAEPIARTDQYVRVFQPLPQSTVNRPLGGTAETEPVQPAIHVDTTPAPAPPQQVQTQPQANQEERELDDFITASIQSKPNIIRGLVTSKTSVPIPSAVISVKNEKQALVRKIVSGSDGSFSLTTPLANGTYFIDIEGDNFKFNRFELILTGKPLPYYKFSAR